MRYRILPVMRQLNTLTGAGSLGNHTTAVNCNKSYKDAVRTLNNLQSNAAVLEKARQNRDRSRHDNLPSTVQFLGRVGLTLDDVDNLSIIHVSGTKGKGSTCAFTESILRAHGYKTGFYSSPHLVEVRERICINGKPLSKDLFSHYFWECYHKLEDTKKDYEDKMPAYFRFLTIMAYLVFKSENVDVAIMEVGIGGRFDCTNIVSKPVVCGVSSVGFDHVTILGETLDKIAYHKGGILKPGVPAFTSPQPQLAMDVLVQCAQEARTTLYEVPDRVDGFSGQLGIYGAIQEVNASLAVTLAHTWMKIKSNQDIDHLTRISDTLQAADKYTLNKSTITGLEQCVWPGRCQIFDHHTPEGSTYFLDGAHTVESVELCADWFQKVSKHRAEKSNDHIIRVLLFNMTGDRDATSILKLLVPCRFDYAVFCPNVARTESGIADQNNRTVTSQSQLKTCVKNREIWNLLHSTTENSDNRTETSIVNGVGNGVSHIHSCVDDDSVSHASSLQFNTIQESIDWCNELRSVKQNTPDISTQGETPDRFTRGETLDRSTRGETLDRSTRVHVLVTGSIHLLGGTLRIIDPQYSMDD